MIEAKRNRLFERMFLLYTRMIMRRHFNGVYVGGLENINRLDRSRPIILCCNHSSWWDGLIAFILSHQLLKVEPFAMMEEKQMWRYRFFRWIGAFSVERESPRQAVESLTYAASVFRKPNVALWIYPQGVMTPNDARPIALYRGVERIAAMLESVQLVPVAHRYEFLMQQRAEAFTLFGEPWVPQDTNKNKEITRELEKRMTGLLDSLRSSIANNTLHEFRQVIEGRTSVNVWFDNVRLMRGGT